jgi:catechol 2,3-dioxygenase-like lactoylglutathione lyase family enzyme
MDKPNLTFNFIGVCVVDWRSAFKFFSETLGLKYVLDPKHGDWATLGGTWDSNNDQNHHSASFELFDRGRPVTERHWGLNQGIRPSFQVSNLNTTMEKLRIPFVVEERPWGKTAEFDTVEGIRFALAEIPNAPCSDDLSVPYIGHVAIKCANFEAMQNFYGNVLGLKITATGADHAVLTQPDGFPFVVLERGGSESKFDLVNTPWEDNAVRASPVFLSVMTKDIQAAYAYLRSQGVIIQRDIMFHASWGGTDFHIADPDGNGIQVVLYE